MVHRVPGTINGTGLIMMCLHPLCKSVKAVALPISVFLLFRHGAKACKSGPIKKGHRILMPSYPLYIKGFVKNGGSLG